MACSSAALSSPSARLLVLLTCVSALSSNAFTISPSASLFVGCTSRAVPCSPLSRVQLPRKLRNSVSSQGLGCSRSLDTRSRLSPILMQSAEANSKKVVVVGAGWAGLGCAHALSKYSGVDVTLVDAAPQPGGLVSGWKTESGREVEAGIHGFWDEYYNIFKLVDDLNLPEDTFTGYEDQGQYSPKGLEAVWPVYRDQAQLPTYLGQAAYTRFKNLNPLQLASAAPLVAAFADFDNSPESWDRWDKISFRDMCRQLMIDEKLYQEAFEPMILTGLFAPGELCSAAAALGMAYYFVLSHQNSFDVRWCKGSVGNKIFSPWVDQLKDNGVDFRAGVRVSDLILESSGSDRVTGVKCSDGEVLEADAVVMAVGITAMQGMLRGSEVLGRYPELAAINNLGAVDVCAVRLWLDKDVQIPYWSNACWGFDEGVGMTFFDLKRIQAPEFDSEEGAVVEVDFYHANSILAMPDDVVKERCLDHLKKALPEVFGGTSIIDSAVIRLPRAVSWFFPGSYQHLPSTQSKAFSNVAFAGDWVRSDHGSWSQEKALVTGYSAANLVKNKLGLQGTHTEIIPLIDDEIHVQATREVAKLVRSTGLPVITDFLRI